MDQQSEMYFTLLKNCLSDNIYGSHIGRFGGEAWCNANDWTGSGSGPITGEIANDRQIENGTFWPLRAHTMIGTKRLNNIEYAFHNVIRNNIDGDFIETGCWRGGACIFMAALCKYYGVNKKVYVADSFEGLPTTAGIDERYPADAGQGGGEMAVSLDQVKSNFSKYQMLSDNVIFIKGFFENSLKNVNFHKLSILRLDGDFYCSTIQVLEQLYDKVSIGGFIIIDDFNLEMCAKAVMDFREKRNILSELIDIDWAGKYWVKDTD